MSILFFMQSRPHYDVVRLSSYRYFFGKDNGNETNEETACVAAIGIAALYSAAGNGLRRRGCTGGDGFSGHHFGNSARDRTRPGDRTGTEFRSNGCSGGSAHGGPLSGFGTEFRPYGRANGNTHRGTCPGVRTGTEFRPDRRANGNTHRGTCPRDGTGTEFRPDCRAGGNSHGGTCPGGRGRAKLRAYSSPNNSAHGYAGGCTCRGSLCTGLHRDRIGARRRACLACAG